MAFSFQPHRRTERCRLQDGLLALASVHKRLPTHRCSVDMHRGTHHKGPRRCSGGVQRRAPWPAAWSSRRALHGQRVHERADESLHTSAIRTHHVQRAGEYGCACPPRNIVYLAEVAHHPTKVRIRVDGLERRIEGLVRYEVGAHVSAVQPCSRLPALPHSRMMGSAQRGGWDARRWVAMALLG